MFLSVHPKVALTTPIRPQARGSRDLEREALFDLSKDYVDLNAVSSTIDEGVK